MKWFNKENRIKSLLERIKILEKENNEFRKRIEQLECNFHYLSPYVIALKHRVRYF